VYSLFCIFFIIITVVIIVIVTIIIPFFVVLLNCLYLNPRVLLFPILLSISVWLGSNCVVLVAICRIKPPQIATIKKKWHAHRAYISEVARGPLAFL